MKNTTKVAAFTAALGLGIAQGALTTEYIGGTAANGSSTSVGGVHTLGDDTSAGDFWDGGDTGTYLYESTRVTGSFSAVVRVVGQSEAATGQWGKAGIMGRSKFLVRLKPGNAISSSKGEVGFGSGRRPRFSH
jgi:hypothetical protein